MKNIRSMTALTALLLVPAATQPMGQAFRGKFTKDNLKKGFNYACKATNIGLTFGPLWYQAYQLEYLKDPSAYSNHDDVPPLVHDFFQQELQKINYHNPNQKVKLCYKLPSDIGAACYYGEILIGVTPGRVEYSRDKIKMIPGHCKIADLLEKKQKLETTSISNDLENLQHYCSEAESTSQELKKINAALNEYRFIAQHEGTHLKNKDPNSTSTALFLAPLIVHEGFKGVKDLWQLCKNKEVTKTVPGIGRSLLNIPAGATKFVLSCLLINSWERYYEQRADNGVVNEMPILQGGIDLLSRHEAYLRADIIRSLKQQGVPITEWNIKMAEFNFDPNHPFLSTRVKKLEQRLAALKEQEQTTEQK